MGGGTQGPEENGQVRQGGGARAGAKVGTAGLTRWVGLVTWWLLLLQPHPPIATIAAAQEAEPGSNTSDFISQKLQNSKCQTGVRISLGCGHHIWSITCLNEHYLMVHMIISFQMINLYAEQGPLQ